MWGLVVQVVAATLAVAPKELGFMEVGVPRGLEELEGYMWGCSGMLGRMVRGWGMPKSNGVDAKAATEFAMADLAAGLCG